VSQTFAAESTIRFTTRAVDPSYPRDSNSSRRQPFSATPDVSWDLFIAGPRDSPNTIRPARSSRDIASAPSCPPPLTALAVGIAAIRAALNCGSAPPAKACWYSTAGRFVKSGRTKQGSGKSPHCSPPIPAAFDRDEKSGVLVYDGRELRPFHSSLDGAQVTALAGNDASLWIGTIDRGVLHYNAGALEAIDDALPDRQILSLALDGDVLYAGTALGVAEIREGNSTAWWPGYFAQSLLAADSKLWMGTLDEACSKSSRSSPGRGVQLGTAGVCPGCSIRKILQIEGEVLALARDSLWRGSQEIIHRDDAILADRNVSALAWTAPDACGRLLRSRLQILAPAGHFEDDHCSA